MRTRRRIGVVAGWFLISLAIFMAIYLLAVRPWHRTWGATRAEAETPMPFDAVVQAPQVVATRAVTIDAAPEKVWPWLVQMGYRRGGLYSYDWIDRALKILDRPSANRILPEFQDLNLGMVIPFGSGPGWPVAVLEPNRTLVFDIRQDGMHMTWSWLLLPLAGSKTRLILRFRGHLRIPLVLAPAFALMDPGEFVMVRRMLLGIKARAEGRPPGPAGELLELAAWAAVFLIGLVAVLGAFLRERWLRLFVVAWAAFLALMGLTLRQPPAWVGLLFAVVLLAALAAALRRGGRRGGNPEKKRV